MTEIVRKMQYDVHPPKGMNKILFSPLGSTSIVSKQPMFEQLRLVWQTMAKRGWIDHESSATLRCLLQCAGSTWFVSNIVAQIMTCRYQDELDKSVDLAFAVFHLDIEQCTMALLNRTLPNYLCNSLLSNYLVEPQSSALAKLCAYAIFASLEFSHYNPTTPTSNALGKKRHREEEDNDSSNASKILRLSEADSQPLFSAASSNCGGGIRLKEPLVSALHQLFRMFNNIANRDGFVSQKTYFMFNFIRLVVSSGKDRSGVILQTLSDSLVSYLLRALPELFTSDLLLKLYDINTSNGRQNIASDLCMLRNFVLRNVKNNS